MSFIHARYNVDFILIYYYYFITAGSTSWTESCSRAEETSSTNGKRWRWRQGHDGCGASYVCRRDCGLPHLHTKQGKNNRTHSAKLFWQMLNGQMTIVADGIII